MVQVTLFVGANKFQADLEGGPSLESKKNETIAAFEARVKKYVQDEMLDEPKITKFDDKGLKRKTSADLTSMLEDTSNLGAEMIGAVLALRTSAKSATPTTPPAETKKRPEDIAAEKKAAKDAEKAEAAKAKAEKEAEKEAAKAAKAAEKEAAKAAKAAEKEAAKATKAPKEKQTLEQVQAAANAARAEINKAYDFPTFDGGETVTGLLVNVVVDKRGPIALLRFKMADGSFKHKSVATLDSLVYNEKVTKEIADAVAAAAAEKEANKKAKAPKGNSPAAVAEKAYLKAAKAADKAKTKYDELQAAADQAKAAWEAIGEESSNQGGDLAA